LREAVTNVLRHAMATRCEIELTTGEVDVGLRVANDGAPSAPPARGRGPERRPGGHGLASLAARTVARGGRLTSHAEGGRFELTVWIPRPAHASTRSGVGDSLAADGPAYGVDEVVGGTVLHKES
jgi:signal transduction histidine kinase